MKRIIFVVLSVMVLVACQPEIIVVTGTPVPPTVAVITYTPIPSDTPIPPTETIVPTPTVEIPIVRESAINANAVFNDGCSTIEKFNQFAGREICKPRGWDWNKLNFDDNPSNQPPPDVASIQGNMPDGDGSYLQTRIDYLTQSSQYCLAQYEYFPDTDFSGNQLNYILKAGIELDAPNLNVLNRPSIEVQITTDSGNTYLQESQPQLDEKFIEDGYNEYIWVIDPLEDVGVHYQFCFNYRGIQSGNNFVNIYLLAVLEATGNWGLDREIYIE